MCRAHAWGMHAAQLRQKHFPLIDYSCTCTSLQAQVENICFVSLACVADDTSNAVFRKRCLLKISSNHRNRMLSLQLCQHKNCSFPLTYLRSQVQGEHQTYALTRLLALALLSRTRPCKIPQPASKGRQAAAYTSRFYRTQLLGLAVQ